MPNSLENRMKAYEHITRNYLTRRIPVIIRVDGKNFSTFTKGLKRPFDDKLHEVMEATTKLLLSNIQGCKLAYTQSDEISLLLTDYDTIETDAWFGYNIQKIASISASMATLYFNRTWENMCDEYASELAEAWNVSKEDTEYLNIIDSKRLRAMFDSRVFSLPKEEVCNYFIWRQQDATRNSIQSVGQTYFSPKELLGVNMGELQDKLFTEKGINWNNFPTKYKRGSCVYRDIETKEVVEDFEIPIFTQDRNYIEKFVYI